MKAFFDLVKGHEYALLQSDAAKAGTAIEEGQWVVFDPVTSEFVPQVGKYDPATQGAIFPVYGGNKVRFDSQALGVVTVAMGKSFVGRTNKVAAVAIKKGDALTVLDGVITKAALTGAEITPATAIIGWCTKANTDGIIEFARA